MLHDSVWREGARELERSASALLWSSIAAALSMGFSLPPPPRALMHRRVGETPATSLLVAFGDSIGFVRVVLGRQQPFTENTLTAVLPVMTRPRLDTVLELLRLRGAVPPGNLVAVVAVFALTNLDITGVETQNAMVRMGRELMGRSVGRMAARGIFAGRLIAILLWLMPAAGHSTVVLIAIVPGSIGLAELTRIVAGAAETLYLVFAHIALIAGRAHPRPAADAGRQRGRRQPDLRAGQPRAGAAMRLAAPHASHPPPWRRRCATVAE